MFVLYDTYLALLMCMFVEWQNLQHKGSIPVTLIVATYNQSKSTHHLLINQASSCSTHSTDIVVSGNFDGRNVL